MLAELLKRSEVTEVCEIGSHFGVMAYHGGNLERTTDYVAAAVAERTGASYYGLLQAPPLRHHVASTRIDPEDSPALDRFLRHVDVVITIHGYGRRRLWRHLLVGGGNRTLARHVAGSLRSKLHRRYRVVDALDEIPRELRGQHPRNPVNLPRDSGVQLELPPSIRWNTREWGWSGHAGVSASRDVGHLVDALAHAIEGWPTRQARAPVDGAR